MLDDLDAAGRFVDGWEASLAERAAKARDLSARLTALTATAHDQSGLITATVGSSGSVVDLRLDEKVRQQSAASTAQQILSTIRAAQARLMAHISDETARAYGQDSATTESIIASYRERLGRDAQPGDVVAVDPASLITHAGHLDGIATNIGAATEAANYVRMDVAAYGQVCAFVPAVLNNLSSPLSEGLGTITQSLRDTASRLRLAASEYAAADNRGTQRTQVTDL